MNIDVMPLGAGVLQVQDCVCGQSGLGNGVSRGLSVVSGILTYMGPMNTVWRH